MKGNVQNEYQKNLEQQKGKRKNRKMLFGVLCVLVIAVAAASGWYVLSGKRTERRYAERMDEGNHYLIRLNYEAAEIAYKTAIEEAPDRADAYEKLANVYIAQNRYEEAGQLLVQGIQHTNAEILVKTYQRVSAILQNLQNGLSAESMTADQLLRISDGLTLDSTIYDIIASHKYRDYLNAYGEPVSAADNSYGGKDVRFDGFAGNVSFRETSYENHRADAVSFDNLSDLLGNYGGAASAGKLQELFGSEMELTVSEAENGNRYYASYAYHGCIVTLSSDEQGNIYGNAANVVFPDPDASSEQEEEREETGGSG